MASSFSNQNFRVGDQIGDYRLLRFIGSGGMGEVYEAEHSELGARGAIKFLRPDHSRRPDLLARFEQEARIASTLESRHIVRVRECHITGVTTPYMIMDLAEGQSLAGILSQQGRLEPARALDLVHQACVGLSVAHLRRIVHRDLKPDNLYVCPLGDGGELLKILDFGIAKHLGAIDSGPTTETGSNLGTAHYMSPEQAQGAKHAIDHRTDLYSLGVILYEMLSGSRPYQGESYNEILIRIVTQRPPPLNVLCPNLPRELLDVVERAMQREPSERFQSADEFAAAVTSLLSSSSESTLSGLAMRPATAPRSPDLITLDSGIAPSIDADALQTLVSPEHVGIAPRNSHNQQTVARPATIGRSVLVAAAAMAIMAALFAWMRSSAQSRHTDPATRTPSTTLLPVRLETAHAAPIPGQTAAPRASTASSESRAGNIAAGSGFGMGMDPGTPRAKALSSPPRSPVATPTSRRAPAPSARKAPGIDDPLPMNPHAPGVSAVME